MPELLSLMNCLYSQVLAGGVLSIAGAWEVWPVLHFRDRGVSGAWRGRGGGGVLLVYADQTTAAAGRAGRRESGPSGAERRQLHWDRQRGSEL